MDSASNDFVSQMLLYMQARTEAEEKGQHTFTCPLCGGEASWARAECNGHLRSGCKKCGFRFIE